MTAAMFDRFITLVEMDQRARHLGLQCQAFEQQQALLQERLRDLQNTLEAAHAQVKSAQKAADTLELELASITLQVQDKKQKLARAATPREYFSLEQEMGVLETQRTTYEDQLFDLWQAREQAQELYAHLAQKLPEQQTELRKQLNSLQEQACLFAREIEAYKEHRASYMQGIDQALLEQYEQMLLRISDPVVPVAQESCTSCFYPVSRLDLATLKQHELTSCKGCYRLLYMPTGYRERG